jgi:hypothetical protein
MRNISVHILCFLINTCYYLNRRHGVCRHMPILVAARSEDAHYLRFPNSGIAGSNPARDMFVHVMLA